MNIKEYVKKFEYFTFYHKDPEKTVFHRERGLPACEYRNGDKAYWENDERHKLDGFALDWKYSNAHFLNGKSLFTKTHYRIV